jgi:hypothetical protein
LGLPVSILGFTPLSNLSKPWYAVISVPEKKAPLIVGQRERQIKQHRPGSFFLLLFFRIFIPDFRYNSFSIGVTVANCAGP